MKTSFNILLFTLFFLVQGCYLTVPAARDHQYKALEEKNYSKEKFPELIITSTPYKKTLLLKFPKYKYIEDVSLCSKFIQKQFKQCINLKKDTLQEGFFLIVFNSSNRKFYREYLKDTIKLTYKSEKENYSLRYVPVDNN